MSTENAMNATVNIVCYKWKELANGENPLMICVCKDGKRKYKSLGISVKAEHWNFEENKPKNNCPNKEQILKLISDKTSEFAEKILDLKIEKKEFTATNLIEKVEGLSSKSTVADLFDSHIAQLRKEGRYKYATSFNELKNSLLDFNKHLDIYFFEIDVDWLKRYEGYLRKRGLSVNSLGVRFRTLRALCNLALEKNMLKREAYPFDIYKVSKLHEETAKRAISKQDVKEIVNYKARRKYEQLAIDLFYFSYLCAGINFKDIAYLTKDNIMDNRIIYTRKKTKKLIKISLQGKAFEIICKYDNPNSKYLFPILSPTHKTDQQKINRLTKMLKVINRYLKSIGKELNIPIDLTTYVARHSFATVLKRSGVSTSIISESLGHSSEKITQIYLDSFENSQIDAAMKNLL